MGISFITFKIKQLKALFIFKVCLYVGLIALFLYGIYTMYVISYYAETGFSSFFLNTFSYIYNDNQSIRTALFISIFIINSLILSLFFLIFYIIYNNKYQKAYMNTIFNELKLNEIYKIEKERVIEDHKFEIIEKFLNIDSNNLEKSYLFTLNSLIKMDFYQYFNHLLKKKYKGIMITSTLEHRFNEFIQFRFDELSFVDTYDEKSVNQFPLALFKNSSTYIYINSSLGKNTYKVIDEKILNELNDLKKFTKSNYVLTLTNYELNLFIENWELKLTDSLFRKLDNEAVDKKVEALTRLIDYLIDIYIYISKNSMEV